MQSGSSARALVLGAALLLGCSREQDPRASVLPIDPGRIENLYLDDVFAGPREERVVEVHFRAINAGGFSVSGLAAGNLELFEDERRVEPDVIELEPLQRTGQGVSAVLAIDASGTMLGEPFTRAREAALSFLERLRPEDRVAVLTFAESISVVAGFELSRVETRRILTDLEIDRDRMQRTRFFDGTYAALDLIRKGIDLPRRSFMVLISDGLDDGSDRNHAQVVARALGSELEPHILIFAIGYAKFGGGGFPELQLLGQETGGEFLEAKSTEQLRDFFDGIAAQMTSSYIARFPSDLDGKEHGIRLVVGAKSAERRALYPDLPAPPWVWLIGLGVALSLGLAGWLLLGRRQRAGELSIVAGVSAGSRYSLRPGRTRIGALADNDIVLSSTTVSRYHAEIVTRGGRVEISDLRSRNGTRVNGQVIHQSPLHAGDRITIADVEMVYER